MYTAQSLVEGSIELLSLPDVYIRLRDVVDAPHSSMSDIAQVISQDPATTARLLKLVNSAFFGLPSQVDTITRAINLLGTQQVNDLVLATSVIDSFSGFDNDYFSIYDFWYSGVYCAVSASLLAYRCGGIDTERPFVGGLLHNIGHLIMYQKIPQETHSTVEMAHQRNISRHIVEREILGFDYSDVGVELMRAWKLPESLQEIIGFHVEPEKAGDFKQEAAIIHIASAITEQVAAQQPVTADTLGINPVCWQLSGLSVDVIPEINEESAQQVSMVMDILFTRKKSA